MTPPLLEYKPHVSTNPDDLDDGRRRMAFLLGFPREGVALVAFTDTRQLAEVAVNLLVLDHWALARTLDTTLVGESFEPTAC